MKYFPPIYNQRAFSCPHCDALSNQTWSHMINCQYPDTRVSSGPPLVFTLQPKSSTTPYSIAKCANCGDISIWKLEKLIYPDKSTVEEANPDLPEDIKADYNEAKEILSKSPRSSAALLRLALQKMLVHLGEKGKSINDDIKNLVKRGVPAQFQQALDSIRVIGNNAVHPGQIDLNDNPQIARGLFTLLNVVCDYFITQPKKVAEIYGSLPEKDLNNIAKRDGSAN